MPRSHESLEPRTGLEPYLEKLAIDGQSLLYSAGQRPVYYIRKEGALYVNII